MITYSTRTLARIIEIANYILLIPATFTVFVFLRGLLSHEQAVIRRAPDLLLYALAPAVFYGVGVVLHFLYFQIAREHQPFVRLEIVWWLSAIYNLLLTIYFVVFGSFVTILFLWPLCVVILSLLALVRIYRARSIHSQPKDELESEV